MRCGAFHRVEGTLCLVRHGQDALSGSKTKAPGFAGGYLLDFPAISMIPWSMDAPLRGEVPQAATSRDEQTSSKSALARFRREPGREALRAVFDASDVRRAEVNRKQQRI